MILFILALPLPFQQIRQMRDLLYQHPNGLFAALAGHLGFRPGLIRLGLFQFGAGRFLFQFRPRHLAHDGLLLRRCLLLGFSDRLAVRLDAGTLRCALVHGRTGELRRESSIRNAKLLVAAEVDEIQARGGVTTYLSLATAIEEAWLQELFPAEFSTVNQVRYDGSQRRVVTRVERRFRDLVLEAKERDDAPSDAASRLLAEEVAA
jgi:hypothetical protein